MPTKMTTTTALPKSSLTDRIANVLAELERLTAEVETETGHVMPVTAFRSILGEALTKVSTDVEVVPVPTEEADRTDEPVA